MKTDKKRGRSEVLNPTQLVSALWQVGGFLSYAAKSLNVNISTVRRMIERYPEVADALDDIRNSRLDFVESKLMQKIEEGELTAIIFFLKTQGKSRGYSQDLVNADSVLTDAQRKALKELGKHFTESNQ